MNANNEQLLKGMIFLKWQWKIGGYISPLKIAPSINTDWKTISSTSNALSIYWLLQFTNWFRMVFAFIRVWWNSLTIISSTVAGQMFLRFHSKSSHWTIISTVFTIVVPSSVIDKKLEIYRNLEIKLEIYKCLENKSEILSYFKLEIFKFFVYVTLVKKVCPKSS